MATYDNTRQQHLCAFSCQLLLCVLSWGRSFSPCLKPHCVIHHTLHQGLDSGLQPHNSVSAHQQAQQSRLQQGHTTPVDRVGPKLTQQHTAHTGATSLPHTARQTIQDAVVTPTLQQRLQVSVHAHTYMYTCTQARTHTHRQTHRHSQRNMYKCVKKCLHVCLLT